MNFTPSTNVDVTNLSHINRFATTYAVGSSDFYTTPIDNREDTLDNYVPRYETLTLPEGSKYTR